MSVIFISYSSEDRSLAQQMSARLRGQGYHALFLDVDTFDGIAAGRTWEHELYSALRRSDAVVFIGTAASVESRWCFAELALARSLGLPVFPVRASEQAQLSLLADLQWVDLAQGEGAYERLWTGLARACLDPADSLSWDPTRLPYPGLRSFSPEDAAVFFGRSEETRHLVDLVQSVLVRGAGRWVTIVGPSGSGKSSLMSAGLLPGLARTPEQWVVVPTFTPGNRPTHQMAVSLARAFAARGQQRSIEDLEGRLTDATEGSAALAEVAQELSDVALELSDASGSAWPRVLIAIDQAEELTTRAGPREQHSFLRLIKGATGEDSPLWVVCTLRSEYLSTAPERTGLTEVTDDAMVLEPLGRNRLSEVIAKPARRAGLELDAGLVERMVEDTTGGDALPLLAHTLFELAQSAATEHRSRIRTSDYELLGGVVGALQRRADRLLEELTRRGHGEVILPTLLKLVSLDQDGEPVRRRLARTSLTGSELQVVDAFVEARLLSSSQDEIGEGATVEVTHEALLRRWAPLSRAIEESSSSLRMRSELDREAADWAAGGREESYLMRGARLATFDEWVSRSGVELAELETAFLAASREVESRQLRAIQRSNRRLRQLLVGVAGLLVVAVVAGVVALNLRERARFEAANAMARQLVAQAAALRPAQPDLALLVGVEALGQAPEHLERDARVSLLQTLNRPFHVIDQHLPHPEAVRTTAFSPDGTVLATGGDDELIRLWDLGTGQQLGDPLAGHDDRVQGVAFSPDGATLTSVSRDTTVRMWDPEDGQPRGAPLTGHDGPVSALSIAPDGSMLATASEDGTVRLWDVEEGRQIGKPLIQQDGPIWSVAFDHDGSRLATAGADGLVRLWDVATRQALGEPIDAHDGWAISTAFSPDGSTLVSAGADGVIKLWDPSLGTLISEPLTGHTGEISDVAFDHGGSLLASAGRDGTVRLWDASTHLPHGDPLTGHANAVRTVDFSPDDRLVASGSFDHTVRVWQVEPTRPGKRTLPGHEGRVTGLAFSPHDPSLLATASADGRVLLRGTGPGQQGATPLEGHDGWVTSVAFSPLDETLIASGGADGTVRLWDVATGRPRGQPLSGHRGEVAMVAFTPDGTVVASAGRDGTVRLWDVEGRRQLGEPLGRPGQQLLDIAFDGDGSTLFAATSDGSVQPWDVDTREPGVPLEGHTGWVLSLAYDAGAGLLASGSGDGTIRLWDAENRRPVSRTLVHAHEVNDVAIGPAGTTLVSTSKDATIRLWDIDTGRPVGEPLTDEAEPVALDFADDGSAVAVGRADGAVQLWNIRAESLMDEACETAGRNMTDVEWEAVMGDEVRYQKTCTGAPGPGVDADAGSGGAG